MTINIVLLDYSTKNESNKIHILKNLRVSDNWNSDEVEDKLNDMGYNLPYIAWMELGSEPCVQVFETESARYRRDGKVNKC